MSPGKKHRYSTTPLKLLDYYYQGYVAALIAEGNNEQITEYLSTQSDEWKRLCPKAHALLLAATSGAKNTAESQFRRNTGKGSLSDVTAISHLLPEVFLNSPTTSGMKLDESMQNPEINQNTAVIASVEIPEQKDTGEKRFQSQICTGKKSRLDTTSPRYKPPLLLGSARTRPIIRDAWIQDTTTKSSTVVTEPVEISGLEGASQVLDATSLCHQPSQESLRSSISGETRPADSAKELSTESNPESFTLAKMPSQEEIALARDEFVQELEHIVNNYENLMSTGPFRGNENDEHFNTFLTQFAEKIQNCRKTLQQSLAIIAKMELLPFLNVSILLILDLKVRNSGIDIEKTWVEFSHLRKGNSNPDMTNMTQYYCRCWCDIRAYERATAAYIKTIPKEFLS